MYSKQSNDQFIWLFCLFIQEAKTFLKHPLFGHYQNRVIISVTLKAGDKSKGVQNLLVAKVSSQLPRILGSYYYLSNYQTIQITYNNSNQLLSLIISFGQMGSWESMMSRALAERLKVQGLEPSKVFYSLTSLIVDVGSQLKTQLVLLARTPTCSLSIWSGPLHNMVGSVPIKRASQVGAMLPLRSSFGSHAASFLLYSTG